MSEPRKHHFVPRFYLKKFADPHTRKEAVHIYDLEQKKWRLQKAAEAALEKDLYSIGAGEEKSQELEKILAVIESDSSIILSKLLDKRSITYEEKEIFSIFVAAMFIRSHRFRQQFAEISVHIRQWMMRSIADHPTGLAAMMSQIESLKGHSLSHEDKEQYEDMIKNPAKYFVAEVDKEYTLSRFLFLERFAAVLLEMSWSVLFSDKNSFFVTSDSPVVYFPKKQGSPHAGGLLDENIVLSIPLSRSALLICDWSERAQNSDVYFGKVHEPFVRISNKLRIDWAYRFVFSGKRDDDVVRMGNARPLTPFGFKIEGMKEQDQMKVKVRRN